MSNELSATINKLAHAREERRKLQDTVAALEFKARQLAIELYKADPENKQPHPAVTIKSRDIYDIDNDTALMHAISAKMFLKVQVDETSYRRAFKASPGVVPGVTVTTENHATIKADLSEWKIEPFVGEITGATVTPVAAYVVGESPKPTLYSNTPVTEETAEEMMAITPSETPTKPIVVLREDQIDPITDASETLPEEDEETVKVKRSAPAFSEQQPPEIDNPDEIPF